MAGGHTVVTHELYEPHRKNRVKIPNACKAFNVPYVSPFDMLREMSKKLG